MRMRPHHQRKSVNSCIYCKQKNDQQVYTKKICHHVMTASSIHWIISSQRNKHQLKSLQIVFDLKQTVDTGKPLAFRNVAVVAFAMFPSSDPIMPVKVFAVASQGYKGQTRKQGTGKQRGTNMTSVGIKTTLLLIVHGADK